MSHSQAIAPLSLGSRAHTGVTYLIEHLRAGEVLSAEVVENLMPAEGRNHMLGVTFKGVAPSANWYLGVFENNSYPADDLKASTVVATLGESVAYTPNTRPAFTPGVVAAGAVDNTAARAEFTFTESKRIYGGFMASSPTRGSGTGVLISAARFAAAKDVTAGDTLRVTAAFELVSASE